MSDYISHRPGILEAAYALRAWLDEIYPASVFGEGSDFWSIESDLGVNAVRFIRHATDEVIAAGGESNPDYEAVFVNKKYFEELEKTHLD